MYYNNTIVVWKSVSFDEMWWIYFVFSVCRLECFIRSTRHSILYNLLVVWDIHCMRIYLSWAIFTADEPARRVRHSTLENLVVVWEIHCVRTYSLDACLVENARRLRDDGECALGVQVKEPEVRNTISGLAQGDITRSASCQHRACKQESHTRRTCMQLQLEVDSSWLYFTLYSGNLQSPPLATVTRMKIYWCNVYKPLTECKRMSCVTSQKHVID